MAKTIKIMVPEDGDIIAYNKRNQKIRLCKSLRTIDVYSSVNNRYLTCYGDVSDFLRYHQFNVTTNRWERSYKGIC